ncbi:electron transport complex subunit RsxB [Polaromonas sp. YR568]|uniref:electron transport complex subunit RsxB n=1 Tax=Polaromonas sp. YR568 TaxID=1855301 RepID=UPI00398C0882
MTSSSHTSLAARLNAALPQTQCTRCGYPDCAAYAQAMASGEAAINQCPPGGAEGVRRLAAITGLPALPLNPANGTEGPRAVAVIDENWCIGCTLCLKACPTDAIMGSNKMMHTVIEPWCTGCELCIPVCPVDCISLENVTGEKTGWDAWSQQDADTARTRYEFHALRYPRENGTSPQAAGSAQPHQAEGQPALAAAPQQVNAQAGESAAERKRAMIEAALERARAKRGPAASG